MSSLLASSPPKSNESTPTTVGYDVRRGSAGSEPETIHKNFRTPLSGIMRKLDDLAMWEEGWDGDDAAAPDHDSIARARAWILRMYEDTHLAKWPWADPHVVVDENGHVVFEWWLDPRKLTVYVTPNTVEFVEVRGPDIFEEMDDGSIESSEDRHARWRWLMDLD